MTAEQQNPLSQIGTTDWYNWKWQQQNSLRQASDIPKYFPNFPEGEIQQIADYERTRRWGITPYTLSLMEKDKFGNPGQNDPLVKQFFPVRGLTLDDSVDSYHGEINWELSNEMPTRILHHKYPHKAIIRVTDSCLGYCSSCFEVGRVEDRKRKCPGPGNDWQKSLEYIAQHPEIKEVIISGGDPLLLDDNSLAAKIDSLKEIKSVRALRLHTRALTFNPFRFSMPNSGFNYILKNNIDALGFNFAHPNEITDNVHGAMYSLNEKGYGGIRFAMIPLLKGINDDKDTLEELFMGLYENGIKPYYLIHCFPGIQGAGQFRTSVRKGVELMKSLKRRISNVAMPEYIIPHVSGKHTVPLEENGTSEFQYTTTIDGNKNPVIIFKNWKGNWETYLDGRD